MIALLRDTSVPSRTFRHRVDHYHVLFDSLEVHYRDALRPVVAEFAVYFVRHQVQVVPQHDIAQLRVLLFGIDVSGRVVRVADQNRFGARRNQPFEILHRRQREVVGDGRRDRLDIHARFHREAVVIGVERLGYQYLVARVQADGHGHENRFRPPDGDHQVVGRHVDADAFVVFDQFAAVTFVTRRMAVFEDVIGNILDGVHGDLRRADVGLPDVQVVDFDSAAFCFFGIRHQFTDRRGGQVYPLIG